MVYYNDIAILIRDMEAADVEPITNAEIAQGWHSTTDKLFMRLNDKKEKNAVCLAAEYMGSIAGYVFVYPDSRWGAFANKGYPEIVDFSVLEKCRRKGVGGKLMDVAEEIAKTYSGTVYLGVGLHSGYGSAQRMYVKRGYIPDGSGAWYGDKICEPYEACRNDDDLILYFSKKLI